MDRRTQIFRGLLLVLVGASLWWGVVQPLAARSAGRRREQVREDAVALTQVLRYDFRVEDTKSVDAAWAKRKPLYDADMLDQLAGALTAFVEFQVAEYADAKDVYVSGRDPKRVSDALRAAQDRLRDAYGGESERMISQFKDAVLEASYRASPKVGGGIDPALPRWDEVYDDLVTSWLPQARTRVAELTSAPR